MKRKRFLSRRPLLPSSATPTPRTRPIPLRLEVPGTPPRDVMCPASGSERRTYIQRFGAGGSEIMRDRSIRSLVDPVNETPEGPQRGFGFGTTWSVALYAILVLSHPNFSRGWSILLSWPVGVASGMLTDSWPRIALFWSNPVRERMPRAVP